MKDSNDSLEALEEATTGEGTQVTLGDTLLDGLFSKGMPPEDMLTVYWERHDV